MGNSLLARMVILFSAAQSLHVAQAAALQPSGLVLEASGSVQFKNSKGDVVAISPAATAGKRAIQKDAPFYEGETLVTGNDGKLRIRFAEGKNEVFLGPNTTLVVQRAPSDLRMKRGTKLFLDAGNIDSVIKQKYSGKGDDEFAVETRTLVAGVRGTVFNVSHNAKTGVSHVSVQEGVVEVRSAKLNEAKSLKAGEQVSSAEWQVTDKTDSTPATKANQKN